MHSSRLKNSNWNLNLPLEKALKNKKDVVALNDSQLLRWIDELNGISDYDSQSKDIKREIKQLKKLPKSLETKNKIKEKYKELYSLQFQKDYVCVIMDSLSDYDRANKGFVINGIKYKRFLGTNGGIKKSTIIYINEKLYCQLKEKLDNGRNKGVELDPAKLEAYQALICSGSIPVSTPRVIVVKDCITKFKADVIYINDENDSEPDLYEKEKIDVELIDSDGYGLMTPDYSKKINGELNGDCEKTITGVNVRYAWTKGMIFTFDFHDFADKIAKSYILVDAWGDKRDIRQADVILTTSQVKLWDSYSSWEDYYDNCCKYKYDFSVTKITPNELENVRNLNYQFIQSYKLANDELEQLCNPTIDEIKDVLGLDYKKSILFLKGFYLDEENIDYDNDFVKALMIDERMIKDPFVRDNIYKMIRKRIDMAKKCSISVDGNFAIVSGDPYSLCQNMFGLEVTGLLKVDETYHKYWLDKGASEIAVFRAPMTCHNNIRKLNVVTNDKMDYWYQYMDTCQILNSWDTTCDALNGEDKDGDSNFCTDNSILLNNIKPLPAIHCVQRKSKKIIPTEEDIIKSNKLSFGDEIGFTTNVITSQFEVQSQFDEDSKEYKTLDYRIMCGQLFQQNAIDKAKGIIAKPIPKEWYDRRANQIKNTDSEEIIKIKEFNSRIVADKKPYFMKYIYPKVKNEYDRYIKNTNNKSLRVYGLTIDELIDKKNKTKKELEFIDYYYKFMPVGINPCVANRICWIFEEEFKDVISELKSDFDYSILKFNVQYSKNDYNKIHQIYLDYLEDVKSYNHRARVEKLDKDEIQINREFFKEKFRSSCEVICPNEKELCDIVLDICYITNKSKQFAWDICGDLIIENLLQKNNYKINIPIADNNGDIEYGGYKFKMVTKVIKEVDDILV